MVPTEEVEGQQLANWLKQHAYRFTHIANEIGISGRVGMLINARKKRQGLSPGFPDYCIVLKNGSLLFIELKRQCPIGKKGQKIKSPSDISEEQKIWVQTLQEIDNVEAHICFGYEEAKKLIMELENKGLKTTL